jgi:uncharacterized protein YndB with AHSA1/START domain
MLTRVLIGLGAIAGVVAVAVARQPSAFHVARALGISAPPEQVFAHVNDLRRWEAWSPWLALDPAARTAYEGPPAGPGASVTWAGNRNVGEGRMTIIESRAPDLVRLRLDFKRPFASTSTAEFTFAPDGPQTLVTWRMSGENTVFAKALHLAVDMDRMIGARFDEGLGRLKAIVEAPAGA